jgi:N-methylhydantoinase B/acetone carboxylase alpha subunit
MESWEFLEPLLYLGRRIKANSSGHGKYRGGLGMESLRMLYKTSSQILFNGSDGHIVGTAGIFGGYPGNSGYRHNLHNTNMQELFAERKPYPVVDGDPEDSELSRLVTAEEEVFDLQALCGPHAFSEYDLYASVQHGAPGLGDPLERSPEAVVEDLNMGNITMRFVEKIYGLVVQQGDDGHWTVDSAATEERRKEIRRQRLERAVDTSEFIARQSQRILDHDFINPVCDMYRSSMALSPSWKEKFYRSWNLPEDFEF